MSDTALATQTEAPVKKRKPKAKTESFTARVNRAEFQSAVASVSRFVERRGPVVILTTVILSAGNGSLLVHGTDLDTVGQRSASGMVDPEFKIALPCHPLLDVLKKAKASDVVRIDVVKETTWEEPRNGEATDDSGYVPRRDLRATLHFNGLKVTMNGLDPADMPEWNIEAPTHSFFLQSSALKKALERTQMAVSTEETRYYLNGVYMHLHGKTGETLRFVATDGHRLAISELPTPDGLDHRMGRGFIIPRKTVAELYRLVSAKGAPETVQIDLCKIKLRFIVGDVTIMTKVIDGEFPDYTRIIPTTNDKTMVASCEEFLDLIQQVSCIKTGSAWHSTVKLSINNSKLTATVSDPEAGTAEASIEVEYTGAPLDIGFQPGYLTDIVSLIESECFSVELLDSGSPVNIRARDWRDSASADYGVLYVLMPKRI